MNKSTKTSKAKIKKPVQANASILKKPLITKPVNMSTPKQEASKARAGYVKASVNKVNDKANSMPFSNPWGNFFDIIGSKDLKDCMGLFLKGTNGSICGIPTQSANNNATTGAKDLLTKLSDNIRNNFEQNMELGQQILKCKTISDFIEFQRKNFEVNYKNTVKLYSDLFHDAQNLTNGSLKGVAQNSNNQSGLMS